jgi:hypothetical protein
MEFKQLEPIKKMDLSVMSEAHKKVLELHKQGHNNLVKLSKFVKQIKPKQDIYSESHIS